MYKKNKFIIIVFILFIKMNVFYLSTQSVPLTNNNTQANLKIIFGQPIIIVRNLYWHKIDIIIWGAAELDHGLMLWHGGFSTEILDINIPARDIYVFKAPRPIGFGIITYKVHLLCDFDVDNADIEQNAILIGSYMIPI